MSFFDPTAPYVSAPMKFYVDAFESTAELGQLAEIFTEQTEEILADADAVLYVTKEQLRDIFKFQTDAADITNALAEDVSGDLFENADIKFYTYHEKFTDIAADLNPANAVVDAATAIVSTDATMGGSPYPSEKMMVAHDFVRHMAEDMFTTPYAVDLFSNEIELLNNIRTVCGLGPSPDATKKYVLENIGEKIKAVDVAGTLTELETDVNGDKYMPNDDILDANEVKVNLGRILFNQMLADVTRITSWLDPSNVELDENTNPRDGPIPLPFMDGDELIFKVILKAAAGQHELVRENNEVADREYRIIWRVGSTPNVAIHESEL